jgi:hypothetical protein
VLARLQRDFESGLRSSALVNGLVRQLKRPAFGDPALDLVEASLPAELVERPKVLERPGQRPFRCHGSLLPQDWSGFRGNRVTDTD